MRARSIYPPYAWGIFHGVKRYETLPRRTMVRGRIAIHATAGFPTTARHRFLREAEKYSLSGQYNEEWLEALPHGVVLGTVEIVDCVPVEMLWDKLERAQRVFGDFRTGRYAAVLRNPLLFARPVPAQGRQGGVEI